MEIVNLTLRPQMENYGTRSGPPESPSVGCDSLIQLWSWVKSAFCSLAWIVEEALQLLLSLALAPSLLLYKVALDF